VSSFEEQFIEWEPHFTRYRQLLRKSYKDRRPHQAVFKIEKFWDWLRDGEIIPACLRPFHFVGYAQDLNSSDLCLEVEAYSPATVALYLGAAKAWSHHLCKTGILLEDPFLDFDAGHPKRTLYQKSLSKEQVRSILNAPDLATPWGIRDQAILEVIYGSGLRSGEAISLTLESVELDQNLLHLRDTKNGWDRTIPLTSPAIQSLIRYLEEARPKLQGPRSSMALWLNYKGDPLGPHAPVTLAVRCSDTVGFKFTMHGLRHACATHLLEGGAKLRHIAELLGHSTIEATGHYAKARVNELQKVHTKTHPRA
jgi:integrase/recombinase XerD